MGLRTCSSNSSIPLPTGDRVERFDEDEPFVLFHPFARGQKKSLSDLAVEEFCHALAPRRVVIVGRTKRGLPVPDNCINLLNHTTILQLIWLLRRARFTVSVDSGPMHIAAALSDRLVSIHTWSDPRKVGPYNQDAWVWKNGALCRVRDLPPPGRREKSPRLQALGCEDAAPTRQGEIVAGITDPGGGTLLTGRAVAE